MRSPSYNQDPREYDVEIDGYPDIDAETYEADVFALVDACLKPIPTSDDPFTMLGALQNWVFEVKARATFVKEWSEHSDDPRENGWVGQDGRP